MLFIRKIMIMLAVLGMVAALSSCGSSPKKIKVLILPKFEIGEMKDDMPGEAQLYYEQYLDGAEEYEIPGGYKDNKLYVKDDVALYVTGESKVGSALSLAAILNDERFDYKDAYVISTGCAGSAVETSVMGDVFIVTATVDYDLGHHADSRDLSGDDETTWFHDGNWDDISFKILNQDLTDQAYNLVRDTELETTPKTRMAMQKEFENAEWAGRDPKVVKGTAVTGDNYWKGYYDEANARLISETYQCPDPYAVTEMEDNALAVALERFDMLDRFLVIRCSVDMDVFMNGMTPEKLWKEQGDTDLSDEENEESAGIFETAMYNNFKVGRQVIDALRSGEIR
ncbi:MAG: hypothetical protein Q4A32_10275 [Lachnospiraceae bacterium]|nr:hypothetical protein [Lachnospiraceae bacterium]